MPATSPNLLAIDPGPVKKLPNLGPRTILTILHEVDPVQFKSQSVRRFLCQCECGRQKVIGYNDLNRKDAKRTISCGCHRDRENRLRKPPPMEIHGLSSRSGNSYLYNLWKGIKRRCLCPNTYGFHRYGGRGISIYPAWESDPAAFANYILSHLGNRPTKAHSLDRIDNDGNYEPGNLRWASRKQQANNISNNRWIEFNGKTQTIGQWAEETGIDYGTIRGRVERGLSPDMALFAGRLRRGHA